MYEARNRPRWLSVPLGSLARLVGTSTTTDQLATPPPAGGPTVTVDPAGVDPKELERIVGGATTTRTACSGFHPLPSGRTRDPHAATRSERGDARCWPTARRVELARIHAGGVFAGGRRQRRRPTTASTSPTASRPSRRRPVPLAADAGRHRPAPDRRRPAREPVGGARRARAQLRDPGRPGHRHLVRRLGAVSARRAGRGRLRLLVRTGLPDAQPRLVRRLGAVHPRRRRRRAATSSRSSAPTACGATRPTRWHSPPRRRRRPHRSSTRRPTTGTTQDWLEQPRRDQLAHRADVDLRGAPRLVAARAVLPAAGR